MKDTQQCIAIVSGEAIITQDDTTIHIVIPAGSRTVIEELIISNMTVAIHLIVEAGAELLYYAYQHCANTTIHRKANVAKHASITWFDIVVNATDVTSHMKTSLCESGARASVYGLFFGSQTQRHTIHHEMHHSASHTTSSITTKGILDGQASVSYNGLIAIEPNAQGCSGYEQAHTLLLSRDARLYGVPQLAIANNDVRCSHGFTTTYVDDQTLFYLTSRGVDTNTARQMLVCAHVQSIIDQMETQKKQAMETLIGEVCTQHVVAMKP